jgi:inhibitor of cysteine peptidase
MCYSKKAVWEAIGMQIFDENAHEREVGIHIGEVFEIALPENPTTGFRWSFEVSGEPFCSLLDDYFEPASQNLLGQGGYHYWHFKAVQAGLGNIALTYRRSWERTGTPARRFTLHVHMVA